MIRIKMTAEKTPTRGSIKTEKMSLFSCGAKYKKHKKTYDSIAKR